MFFLFVYFLDYCRIRLVNDVKVGFKGGERQFNGIVDVYRKILKLDGIVGLYRGFVIFCVGIVVYRGFYFGFYDILKLLLLGEDVGFIILFVFGYGVIVFAGLMFYSIDIIRRRMMMILGEVVKYRGLIDCIVQIFKNEGFMLLMKGVGVNILRGMVGVGVFVGFDEFKKLYISVRFKE